MNSPIALVLIRCPQRFAIVARQLEGSQTVIACESLEKLRLHAAANHVAAVLVHLDEQTLGTMSPGRFIAELDDAANGVRLIGLLEETCPPKLRKLAERVIEDCLDLPHDLMKLTGLLVEKPGMADDLEHFWAALPHKELQGHSRSLVTFAPDMFDMLDELKVAARHHVTVLLVGETGSGKTHLARLIHELTDRRDERFCTVACGALPPDLIESELFGSVKGAFTGADRNREGKFAAAGKGTLLLDEIDVLTPEQQAKLLRVIETGEYEQVGSNETRHSEARLIVASNYNLEELVQQGTFRTDLYYRLNILSFRLPPLRERPLDIEYLARKFAIEHSRTHNIVLREIEPAFLEALRRYPWPGNIREMENVIRRAVLYCQHGVLSVKDLPGSIRMAANNFRHHHGLAMPTSHLQPTLVDAGTYSGIQPGQPVIGSQFGPNGLGYAATSGGQSQATLSPPIMPGRYTEGYAHGYQASTNHAPVQYGEATPTAASQHATATATLTANPRLTNSLETRVDVLEQRIIEDTLRRNQHRRKETAAELGISRVTLYNKMKKFGLL